MHGATANIDGITDQVRVPLHVVRAQAANDSAHQNQQRKSSSLPQRFRQSFHRKRSETIHPAITLRVRLFRGTQQFVVGFKFRGQTKKIFRAHAVVAFCGSATNSRDSEIEIIGRKRMNKNNRVRNNPTLPKSVAQSQTVGKNMPQADGTKSRCKLVTMMTNRSSHMPRFTDSATMKRVSGLRRMRVDQSACGTSTLKNISAQNIQPYGPKARLVIMYSSKMSPLYHDMNASMK